MQFFSNIKHNSELDMPQSIIDFMNENAKTPDQADCLNDSYKEIHSKFKNKSSWTPNSPNKTQEVFKGAFKMNLLKPKIPPNPPNQKGNLTKLERLGLTELANNPNIVIL